MSGLDLVPKPPRLWLVHGIHSKEGTSNVRRLAPYFEMAGFEVRVFEYGWMGVWGARWRNPDIAWRLADLVGPDDHVVCHSNGAAIAWLAMREHGMRCTMLSLIAPALDNDAVTAGATWTDVYHNECDHVVWLSRLLWWHAWGSMGRDGVLNVDGMRHGMHNVDVARHARLPQICGHLAYFNDEILPRFAPYLVERHLRRL